MRREEQDAATVGTSKAGFEKLDERHLNLAQRNGFRLHN
jgi:hypothetical protein